MPDPRHLVIYALLAICAGLGLYTLKLKGDIHLSEMARKNEALVFERERLRAAEVLIKRQDEYRQVETNLTAALTIEREKANEANAASDAVADDLRRRLRIAQANAATAALVSSATQTAEPGPPAALPSGAVLPVAVGDDLVSLAQRAERVRVALLGCYRSYDRARAEIEALNLRSTVE